MTPARIIALAVFLAALLVVVLLLLAMRHSDGILLSAIGKPSSLCQRRVVGHPARSLLGGNLQRQT